MTYTVTITTKDGQKASYSCGGATEQEALIYAGKVVEENASKLDPDAVVTITKNGKEIGPNSSVADMTTKAI